MTQYEKDQKIKQKLNSLTLNIALLKYDIELAQELKTPIHFLKDMMAQLYRYKQEKNLIILEKFHLLPYSIHQLYL